MLNNPLPIPFNTNNNVSKEEGENVKPGEKNIPNRAWFFAVKWI